MCACFLFCPLVDQSRPPGEEKKTTGRATTAAPSAPLPSPHPPAWGKTTAPTNQSTQPSIAPSSYSTTTTAHPNASTTTTTTTTTKHKPSTNTGTNSSPPNQNVETPTTRNKVAALLARFGRGDKKSSDEPESSPEVVKGAHDHSFEELEWDEDTLESAGVDPVIMEELKVRLAESLGEDAVFDEPIDVHDGEHFVIDTEAAENAKHHASRYARMLPIKDDANSDSLSVISEHTEPADAFLAPLNFEDEDIMGEAVHRGVIRSPITSDTLTDEDAAALAPFRNKSTELEVDPMLALRLAPIQSRLPPDDQEQANKEQALREWVANNPTPPPGETVSMRSLDSDRDKSPTPERQITAKPSKKQIKPAKTSTSKSKKAKKSSQMKDDSDSDFDLDDMLVENKRHLSEDEYKEIMNSSFSMNDDSDSDDWGEVRRKQKQSKQTAPAIKTEPEKQKSKHGKESKIKQAQVPKEKKAALSVGVDYGIGTAKDELGDKKKKDSEMDTRKDQKEMKRKDSVEVDESHMQSFSDLKKKFDIPQKYMVPRVNAPERNIDDIIHEPVHDISKELEANPRQLKQHDDNHLTDSDDDLIVIGKTRAKKTTSVASREADVSSSDEEVTEEVVQGQVNQYEKNMPKIMILPPEVHEHPEKIDGAVRLEQKKEEKKAEKKLKDDLLNDLKEKQLELSSKASDVREKDTLQVTAMKPSTEDQNKNILEHDKEFTDELQKFEAAFTQLERESEDETLDDIVKRNTDAEDDESDLTSVSDVDDLNRSSAAIMDGMFEKPHRTDDDEVHMEIPIDADLKQQRQPSKYDSLALSDSEDDEEEFRLSKYIMDTKSPMVEESGDVSTPQPGDRSSETEGTLTPDCDSYQCDFSLAKASTDSPLYSDNSTLSSPNTSDNSNLVFSNIDGSNNKAVVYSTRLKPAPPPLVEIPEEDDPDNDPDVPLSLPGNRDNPVKRDIRMEASFLDDDEYTENSQLTTTQYTEDSQLTVPNHSPDLSNRNSSTATASPMSSTRSLSSRGEETSDWDSRYSKYSMASLDVMLDEYSDAADERANPDKLEVDFTLSLDLGPRSSEYLTSSPVKGLNTDLKSTDLKMEGELCEIESGGPVCDPSQGGRVIIPQEVAISHTILNTPPEETDLISSVSTVTESVPPVLVAAAQIHGEDDEEEKGSVSSLSPREDPKDLKVGEEGQEEDEKVEHEEEDEGNNVQCW